ncbi:hypothetical protein [Halalkalibacter urbisdiaboli]|uniref:hypothetical protein n=1 Tax=Halalkalibacter urbisdiaboli TaxID=1960589 RepID=UPI000B4311DC|nr:hypothetical protein [Halalkalibacter urbisdiaboli]
MDYAKRYVWLCILFTILFGLALWLLEIIEGSKITTSEHLDFGLFLVGLGALFGFFLFFLTFFPLTLFIQKFLNILAVKLVMFTTLAAWGGTLIFDAMYVDWFIEGYNLNVGMAMILYGIVGFIYAVADHFLMYEEDNHNHSFEA